MNKIKSLLVFLLFWIVVPIGLLVYRQQTEERDCESVPGNPFTDGFANAIEKSPFCIG